MDTLWFEIAIVSTIYGIGNVLFGHFEIGTPKWRRVSKLFVLWLISVAISYYAGRIWFFMFLGVMLVAAAVVHFWYLPKHGIHPLTAEPKERYYRLRGWKHLLKE